jgi:hypothetical protein
MAAAIHVRVLGLGLVGPGLPSWSESLATLRGERPHATAPTAVPAPLRLPPAERRRAGAAVKIALAVADAACQHADADPQGMASVFTSSSGDGANCHALCEALASADPVDRLISPTRFTNSVHNAAAGYWHIAVASRQATTSLCAHDDSFGAGLVAALTQMAGSAEPMLVVASDTPYPEPLNATRPLPDTLGVALVLAPQQAGRAPRAGQPRLAFELLPLADAGAFTPCQDASLEALRTQLPAARALPLLEAIARGRPARLVLPASPETLALRVSVEFEA